MRRTFSTVLTATMLVSGHALGDVPSETGNAAKAGICVFPDSRKRAPTWVCKPKAQGWAITAVGRAAKSDAGIAFMEQQAAADARAKLVRRLNGEDNKKSTSSDGTVITETIHASLRGTRILKSVYGPDGTLYVLVGYRGDGADQSQQPLSRRKTKALVIASLPVSSSSLRHFL